jgi:DNA-binding NarL/FixJ family response regulator
MSRRQVPDHPRGDETVTTLLLADDHAVVRLGLRRLLEGEPGLDVVGEVGDGLELLLAVERLRPDVLLLDLMMPGLSGLEALRQVRKRYPKMHVVILSMHATEAYVFEALRNGAAAYVLKGSGGSEVREAVRAVIAGRRYLSPPLSERAIQSYVEKADGVVRDAYDGLSGREREVLQLSAEGHSNSEIAARLFISRRTVESHRAKLFEKLGLHSQTDLVRYALRRGIIKLDE